MKKIMLVLFFMIQASLLFAFDRFAFDKEQMRQENIIKIAFSEGRITQLEYNKLIRQQEIIKERIEDADMDHYWTTLEHKQIKNLLKQSDKKVRRYQRNREVY